MPFELKALPVSEYRNMQRYYVKYREAMDEASSGSYEPTDGVIIE